MVRFTLSNAVKPRFTSEQYELFVTGLKNLYKKKLLSVEKAYHFHYFHSPQLEDIDFEAKPMIMFVGQYSTGKTTLIKHLLKTDFPGIRIGPEPTTDKFISVMFGNSDRMIPGNALVVDPKRQYRPLSKFGNTFLNKFQCSTVHCDVLKNLTIIDTPGILSGEKQRVNRGYDFVGVLKWFAERVDRMILLFDAHKLDISDEFKRCIEALQGHDEKIRIVLNKSDMVDQQQLMRVYGALMWSLGKIINTPEITRVYIGSFWDHRLQHSECKKLFEMEQNDLLKDLMSLPKNSAIRKLNDFIKRVRLVKVHSYVMGTLHKNMPLIFGREKKKNELISSLESIFHEIQLTYNIPLGDFPDCKKMQEQLAVFDFSKLYHLDRLLLEDVNRMLDSDVAVLMDCLDLSEDPTETESIISGGVFDIVKDTDSPFGFAQSEGINAGFGEKDWIVNKQREKYDIVFKNLKSSDGKVSLRVAKSEMIKSQLPNSVLSEIWKLSDVDNDGSLDCDEFALAMYLIDIKLNGYDLPSTLPKHLIPPTMKQKLESEAS